MSREMPRESARESAAANLGTFLQTADRWLSGAEGRREMIETIRRDMLIAYQIEAAEGQKGGAGARQSRKQQLALAELIYKLTEALDDKERR